jgi:hypothetical protein
MKKLLLGLAVVGTLAVPGLASAQVVAGPSVAFHEDADFGIGAFVNFPLEQFHESLEMTVSFGYFFPDSPAGVDRSYWEINGDVIYNFTVAADAPASPFVLGGLNIARASNATANTDIGLNVGGGVVFPSASFEPSVGVKIEIGGSDPFVLFAGLGFPVGT